MTVLKEGNEIVQTWLKEFREEQPLKISSAPSPVKYWWPWAKKSATKWPKLCKITA
jgi:hypothetical protein